MALQIYFENDGDFITAHDGRGVVVRVRSDLTDIGMDEGLQAFIVRHDGPTKTTEYLLRIEHK